MRKAMIYLVPIMLLTAVAAVAQLYPLPRGNITQIAPFGVTSTPGTAAPTAGTFSKILTASSIRKGCTIQNMSGSFGYLRFGDPTGATVNNTNQIDANGGTGSCNLVNGLVLQDDVYATCASGTCLFILSSQQ